MWLRLIVEGVGMALASVSLTSIVRALVPKTLATRKPISCDLCMSFWTTFVLALGVVVGVLGAIHRLFLDPLVLLLPVHGLALVVLSKIRPFEFPSG